MSEQEIISRKEAKELGLKRYFTGKPCTHNHASDRLVSTGQCRECLKIRSKAQWQDDEIRDKKKKQLKQYVNKDKTNEYNKEYNKRPDVIERRKLYNKNYQEKMSSYEDFLERKRKNTSTWCRENKDKANLHKRARRNRLRASGSITSLDIQWLLDNQNNMCAEPTCRKDLSAGYHVDHIMPVKLGGDNSIGNLQCLCVKCNLKKSSKHPYDWAQENGRLL